MNKMAKTRKLLLFLANVFFCPATRPGLLLLACVLAFVGCGVKNEVKIVVSPKILAARNADFNELLAIVNQYEKISDLKSTGMKVTLTSGKWESGRQDTYRTAPGHILFKQPSLLHLVIHNPMGIIRTTIFQTVSAGDEFSAWGHGSDKVYLGRNSARGELVSDDWPGGIPLRPKHVYDAVIPAGIDPTEPGLRISIEESADKTAKYYILSVYKEGAPPLIHTVRRIWIERSQLAISRMQSFDDAGRLVGDINYSEMTLVGGVYLPLKMDIDRPEDGYSLTLEFANGSWGINSGLDEGSFVQPQREWMETVELREKTDGNL